jgi:steroid delta-isomerase-like uncharacterized protein
MATSTTSGTAVVRELFAAIDAHDTARMRALWTPGTSERMPDRTCHGPDEIAAYFQGLFDAFPDLRMELLAAVEEDDTVFAHWRATGTHTGARFQGVNPTGKRMELHGMDRIVIRDGKIESNFVVFDQMEVGRQLGLLPPDGSPPDRALKAGFNALLAAKARLNR